MPGSLQELLGIQDEPLQALDALALRFFAVEKENRFDLIAVFMPSNIP